MPKWILCCNLSVALLLFAPIASAESDYLCDAQQAAVNQLPVLDAACPIGDACGQKAQAGRLSVLDPVWHVKQTDAARHSKNPL